MAEKVRLSVLCSGNGSNLQALIDNVQSGVIPGEIIKVTVDKKDAYAIKRAEAAGIPTDYFNKINQKFVAAGEKDPEKVKEGRSNYDAALAERILNDKPELVVLAGWMHVFSASFLRPLAAVGVDVINLHPARPGCYDGAGAIQRAYADYQAGVLPDNTTGIMIHHVIEQVDRGAPILVKDIVIQPGESLEQLTERMHGSEHELIVEATAIKAKQILAKRQSAS
ncbi:phosphoribosylglycinamide formyltransferase [Seiridium cupressi]